MKEFDDTVPPPEPNNECIDSYSRKRVAELSSRLRDLEALIRELQAAIEDLHATDSARRLNQVNEDPEWY